MNDIVWGKPGHRQFLDSLSFKVYAWNNQLYSEEMQIVHVFELFKKELTHFSEEEVHFIEFYNFRVLLNCR